MFVRTRNMLAALIEDLRSLVLRAQRRVDPDTPPPGRRDLSEPPEL
jgi:hypothetical protein